MFLGEINPVNYSLFGVGVWFLLLILGYMFAWLYNFIMEPSKLYLNPIISGCMKLAGFKVNPDFVPNRTSSWRYVINTPNIIEKADGWRVITVSIIIIFFAPILLWLILNKSLYMIVIGVVVSLVFLSRFLVRMVKLCKKHIADKNVHQEV